MTWISRYKLLSRQVHQPWKNWEGVVLASPILPEMLSRHRVLIKTLNDTVQRHPDFGKF
ncbi:hypothetical protein NDI37_23715 [Funiculus sociatus GB2-A5]|uniref:Uncharacterized protein n=1 Tax=Funiculus sociatus GB2-A5 TaxID=2933946 RepID=A0ABV0JVM4_9CYAN|nr:MULTISPECIES: hypothetical protein [unclassified Trichocoleus]MBD1907118.1 hypothetical protein [Trichocoleus sp. FACHB-832]MBD2060836.1 hypothetical protein [Trichocoleus sp. FACHB-6]